MPYHVQYYATVNVREPGTGVSPVMLAFQGNLVEVRHVPPAVGHRSGTSAVLSCAVTKLAACMTPGAPPTAPATKPACLPCACAQIAKLLLAYGADPTITAKNGKKATDVRMTGAWYQGLTACKAFAALEGCFFRTHCADSAVT